MRRISRYTIYAIIAFIACLIYNYGFNRSCSHRANTTNFISSPSVVEAKGYASIKNRQANISPTDFSDVGFVDKVEGLPEIMLTRRSYIVSYNPESRCPNWVAWRLTKEHAYGDVSRMGNAFHEDLEVPEPRAVNPDFKGSGYSRGHMCPAGDNKWDREAMYETFLLSNVCPQNANLNSGVWNQIEISCRQWAEKYGDIYIICGPMFFKSSERLYIGINQIAVPDAFFKVILCLNDTPKAIGFICRNTDGNRKKDQYINSLSQVERLTGLHFFPKLNYEKRALVESNANIDEW